MDEKKTLQITRTERETANCPLCDGCGKMIETATYWTWLAEDEVAGVLYDEAHYDSHKRQSCVGRVMAMIYDEPEVEHTSTYVEVDITPEARAAVVAHRQSRETK